MIIGIFHEGSGCGNQLFRYVATRVLATDKGYDWGMMNPKLFKGSSFMDLDMGKPIMEIELGVNNIWSEKKIVENGIDIRGYDPEFNFIGDHTIIDGEFQDPRYFEHRLPEVNEWLKVEPIEVPDDVCVIGFRGGEFALYPDLFLRHDYWEKAISKMQEINPEMKFQVHTDDEELARKFFPEFNIIHSIGINWRSMRYAKYAIIANSSFYILPRLLKHSTDCKYNDGTPKYCPKCPSVTIAPRCWARRNTKVWSMPQNYYKQFTYI